MPIDELYPVFDDEDMETPYFIDSQSDEYFNAYVIVENEPMQIARIRKWHNNVVPYEDLDTGVMYDSIAYLCGKVTAYEYEQY